MKELLVLPFFGSILFVLLSTVVNCLRYRDEIDLDSKERGAAFFKLWSMGQDWCLFSLGLMVSSKALTGLLASNGVKSLLGDETGDYFFNILVWNVICLIANLFFWQYTRKYNHFPIREDREEIPGPTGGTMRVTVYRLDLRGGLTSRGGIMNLLLGNGLGISTLALYAYFIYSAFIARPA